MKDAQRDYWAESMAIAAEECGVVLTPEQLECFAGAAENSHEHYGQAFYSPPASDRLEAIQREHERRAAEQQKDFDKERQRARELDEDRQRTIRRQADRIQDLLKESRAQ